MAINNNALSINSSIAANSSFQARSPDSGFGAVNDTSGADGEPGASSTHSQVASGDSGSTGSSGSTSGSGSAGPTGGTAAHPVGTVFIAVAGSPGSRFAGTTVKERHFAGDRHQIQTLAAYAGLQLVRQACV